MQHYRTIRGTLVNKLGLCIALKITLNCERRAYNQTKPSFLENTLNIILATAQYRGQGRLKGFAYFNLDSLAKILLQV